MEDFALEKETWFRSFLELPNGIPSHDTLSDVMGRLKPDAFTEAFLSWVRAALPSLSDEPVCVDGKRLRGSRAGDSAVHRVSAYAAKARLVLTQKTVADKANEIVAIPEMLSMLELKGTVVTMDASVTRPARNAGSFADLGRFAEAARGHWGIENGQHGVLDVQFGEDANRARKDHSAENLARVRRMALNVIRRNAPSNVSLRR
ncbi:MAG: ISAs1 family transposase, partial [Methylococcaceae bacterium]|nr:ISAs1 family transposase [Methylococcaceae bacterium]